MACSQMLLTHNQPAGNGKPRFLEYVKLLKHFYQTEEARLTYWEVPIGVE